MISNVYQRHHSGAREGAMRTSWKCCLGTQHGGGLEGGKVAIRPPSWRHLRPHSQGLRPLGLLLGLRGHDRPAQWTKRPHRTLIDC